MRFWISWEEPEGDYRPITVPAPEYWCTGYGEDYSTLCAIVDADTEAAAKNIIEKFWYPKRWRFCEERADDWEPPKDRFPR